MSEIKALEEMRKCYSPSDSSAIRNKMLAFADAIQAEVDSRFIELPLDADGEPWSFADKELVDERGEICALTSMRVTSYGRWELGSNCKWHLACDCRHVKQRTLEDVLFELVECAELPGGKIDDGDIEAFAAEIRGMLGQ